MKVFKMVMGILLFWVIVLIGGGIVGLLMMFIDKIIPRYFGEVLRPLLCNLAAAVLATAVLDKLTDGNRKAMVINFILGIVVTAVLTFSVVIAGSWTWLQLIGYILVVIYFGVMTFKMATEKEEAPGVSAPRAKEKEEGE